MKRILLTLFLCSALICSCTEIDTKSGTFIQTRGFYQLARAVSLDIFKDSNGMLNIRHTYSDGNSSKWVDGIVDEETDWFIYVSDFDEIWLAKEDDLILLYEEEKSSGSYSIFSCSRPVTLVKKVFDRVPDEVMSRIGRNLLSRIQKAEQVSSSNPLHASRSEDG